VDSTFDASSGQIGQQQVLFEVMQGTPIEVDHHHFDDHLDRHGGDACSPKAYVDKASNDGESKAIQNLYNLTNDDEGQFWLTRSATEEEHRPLQRGECEPMSVHSHEVGVAYTTNDEVQATPQYNQHYEEQKRAFEERQQEAYPSARQGYNGIEEHHISHSPANEIVRASDDGHRVFGLSRDLAGYSPDSAFLPSPYNGLQPMAAILNQQHSMQGGGATVNPMASSSKLSTPSLDKAMPLPSSSASDSSSQALPSPQAQAAPPAAALANTATETAASPSPPLPPAGSASHFSIEVIAPSFDKRGYPIFSGRAARIRGIIRMKALRGCQVVINLGAYISQGAQAAVWDGVALMPPESGSDHKVFSIREVIELDESMLRAQLGSIDADGIFETSFDINLPLGMSTRFVNGEPTVTAVALPPSYEMSSEVARERDPSRAGSGLLKSSAASIRSRSSRITTLTTTGTQIGASVRDAVERGFGEVYRIGCFYKMDFTLQRSAEASGISQPRKFFGRNKAAKFSTLDRITVPFIFLGEQSTEQPPPLSIPAVLIATAVAQPGSVLGSGWQCERATVKWPGRAMRQLKRNVELELHMPDPSTIHAPSLFPVLIILRPEDSRLLQAVPAEAYLGSPITDEGQGWNKGRSHSRQTSASTQRPTAANNHVTNSPTASQMANGQEQETLDSYDTATPDRYGGTDGMLSKFMRSSLSLSRKGSYGNGLPSSRAGHPSAGQQSSQLGGSTVQGDNASSAASFVGSQSTRRGGGGHSSLRDAVANKLRKRPSTAPPSQTSSEARSRVSGSTVLGSNGQYIGALSGLVRVTLVQTTFCVASGPSELPKNLRKLISIAEVEELDTEALRQMAQPRNKSAAGEGPDNELQKALQDQIDGKGVRVLRALFRVGSDPTPSFRCHGIELRYGIKVDLVPFSVRQRHVNRPPSTGAASAGSGGGGTESVTGAMPRSATSSTMNVSSQQADTVPSTSAGLSEAGGTSGASPSFMSGFSRDLSAKRSMDFSLFRGTNGAGSEYGGDHHVPRSGDTVVSTVYADRAHSYNKIEKGVGVLFANVRLVRAAV
jgi:hypothetical protein